MESRLRRFFFFFMAPRVSPKKNCRRQDETEEFLRLSVDPDHHIPVIHLHFNDDLTEVPGGLWDVMPSRQPGAHAPLTYQSPSEIKGLVAGLALLFRETNG